ncbi:MAG: hypothetical protein WC559_03080 [Candidatus Omnitrophota bacterium]
MKVKNFRFPLLTIIIAAALLLLYGAIQYAIVIKIQNDTFLYTISQSISQLSLRLQNLESRLERAGCLYRKSPHRQKQKDKVSRREDSFYYGNRGFIIKNGKSTLSVTSP